jgi:hypothetical protein
MKCVAPDEVIPHEVEDYILMKHFKCLPSELDKEDQNRLMSFLIIDGLFQSEHEKLNKMKNGNR